MVGGTYGRQITLDAETKSLELTAENVFRVMESINLELIESDTEFSYLTVDDIALLTGIDSSNQQIYLENVEPKTKTKYVKNDDGTFKKNTSNICNRLLKTFEISVKPLPDDALIKGYKAVFYSEDGKIYPSVRRKSGDVTYNLGQPTEATMKNNIGIYVFNDIKQAKNRAKKGDLICEATYKLEDVCDTVKNGRETQVKRMTLTKIIEQL